MEAPSNDMLTRLEHGPLSGLNNRTVSSCVRLGEYPSAETMVGVLRQISQFMRPMGGTSRVNTSWQDHKAIRHSLIFTNICMRDRGASLPLSR